MSGRHDIASVPLVGDVDVRTAPALRRTLESLLESGTRSIILNMAEVPYIDSCGIGVIIGIVRRMRAKGGLLSLVNVSPDVLRSLRIARLVDFMPVSKAGQRCEVPELDPSALPLWRTTLPVNKDDLQASRARITELAQGLAFTPDELFDITVAAGEALGNACDHTCGDDVLATVSAYPDRLVVEVTDRGGGFEESSVEGKVAPDAERGRGIKLMRLLVDSVTIKERSSGTGTLVRLTKLV